MEPPNDPRRRNSMEQPPRMQYSFKCLEKELVEVFMNEYPQIQQSTDRLCAIRNTFEEDFRCAVTGSQHGNNSRIAGGVMMGLGILFAPLTLGASAVVAGAGAAVATVGAIRRGVWNSKKSSLLTKFKDFKAELEEFQSKIFCMNGKMKATHQLIEEIMRDINNPQHEVSYLGKYFDSAYELSRFIRIYDAGGLAEKISQTVRLTGKLTGIVARVQSGLDTLSNSNDTKELDDMKKEIQMLQNIMNVINQTKDRMST